MNEERYRKARKRVEQIKSFYIHLITYIIVNAGLFVLNMITSPKSLWFYWPLFGWGIGIAAHALSVFGLGGQFGREWEENKIKEIMEKEEQK